VGDLLYADTTTTLAKLPDVATGNVLISGGVGVAPSWGKVSQTALSTNVVGNGPAFSAYISTAQTVSNNTLTKMQFNAEEFDTNSNFDSTTNYRFTPTVAGYYQINANASLGGGAVGATQCAIYKNGAAIVSGSGIVNNVTIGGMVTASTLIYLNGSTDYVEFYVWQNTGGSINLQTQTGFNTFSASMARSA
jgi:hypothetical protein